MKFGLLVLSFFLVTTSTTYAGSVFIYISSGKTCSNTKDPEITTLDKNSEETITLLDAYFKTEISSTTEAAAIVNAGLKFCDDDARRKVFEFLLSKLNDEKMNKSVIEVTRNYRQSKIMKELIRDLKAKSNSPQMLKRINQVESK